ncbi:flavodoxin family protein [Methanoculleus sp. FWC-SCC3]|uniref:Flavodoxin family protein n=1 Tax=Methanoculleus methanifontis TaxID=2584086 RepID=A0ABT8M265_9EURY|nr:flavodoxin family protein [Methanoculleus sp. FWC-SCC3]MDN7011976.1 flavodoxin family protein [Methanoculleus sp. FWC-SCC3]
MTTGKVVLLCGSPRPGGNTAQVLGECAKVLEREGIETETVLLGEKRILSCTACGLCTEGECALDDGLNEIIEKIREADGLIVGSPVYFGTARGDVTAALQRIGMVSVASDAFLSRKVGGPIAVARRGGHTATLQELLMFFLMNDMIVPGSTYWNMVFGRTPGEALGDEEGVKTVRRFAENVAFLIKKLR